MTIDCGEPAVRLISADPDESTAAGRREKCAQERHQAVEGLKPQTQPFLS